MADDDLLRFLAKTVRELPDDNWLTDERWDAYCAGKLSPKEMNALRHETRGTPMGEMALEVFRPIEANQRLRFVKRVHDEQLRELVAGCLSGQPLALETLVDLLTPIIQARVARILLRQPRDREPRNLRHDVEDLTQEMFVILFADDAKVLRSWNPDKGLSLENFAGLVTERQVTSILRSGKRNPWREDPTLSEEFDEPSSEADPEMSAASKEEMMSLLGRLREALSPDGWHLFDLLFLREWTVEQISEETGKTAEAIYAWRSRLRRLAKQLLNDIRS